MELRRETEVCALNPTVLSASPGGERESTFGPLRAFFEAIKSVRKLILEGKSFNEVEVDHTLAGSLW